MSTLLAATSGDVQGVACDADQRGWAGLAGAAV